MTEVEHKPGKPKPSREQPWAVRGVSEDARHAAKSAAERSHQSLGAWLEQAVKRAADDALAELPDDARKLAKVAADRAGKPVGAWLEQVIRLAVSEQLGASKQLGPTQDQMVAQLAESVQRLADRLDQAEQDRQQHQARGLFAWMRRKR